MRLYRPGVFSKHSHTVEWPIDKLCQAFSLKTYSFMNPHLLKLPPTKWEYAETFFVSYCPSCAGSGLNFTWKTPKDTNQKVPPSNPVFPVA